MGGKIEGSNYYRKTLKKNIMALMIENGMPSLFITINPSDICNPIVSNFAGKEVDHQT